MDHVQQVSEKMKDLQHLFDAISRNIYIKSDYDKESYESKSFIVDPQLLN
jgi:hypothetical protein